MIVTYFVYEACGKGKKKKNDYLAITSGRLHVCAINREYQNGVRGVNEYIYITTMTEA